MYFLFWNFSICCLVLDFVIFLIRIVIKYILCVILYSIVSEKDKNCYIKCKSCYLFLWDYVLMLYVLKRGRGLFKKLIINGYKEYLNDL